MNTATIRVKVISGDGNHNRTLHVAAIPRRGDIIVLPPDGVCTETITYRVESVRHLTSGSNGSYYHSIHLFLEPK